jgi:hypothetical protein
VCSCNRQFFLLVMTVDSPTCSWLTWLHIYPLLFNTVLQTSWVNFGHTSRDQPRTFSTKELYVWTSVSVPEFSFGEVFNFLLQSPSNYIDPSGEDSLCSWLQFCISIWLFLLTIWRTISALEPLAWHDENPPSIMGSWKHQIGCITR